MGCIPPPPPPPPSLLDSSIANNFVFLYVPRVWWIWCLWCMAHYCNVHACICTCMLNIRQSDYGHSNFLGFPPAISTRLFCYISCKFKRPSLRYYLDWKFHILSPFCICIFDRFFGFLIQKGTNCETLNLNNRRLLRLKVTKKVLNWWGKPYKKILHDDKVLFI